MTIQEQLKTQIKNCVLPSYVYGYPSKRAYEQVDRSLKMKDIWGKVDGNLNLYIHIPFCKYRCSYCTLFMVPSYQDELLASYVDALIRQIDFFGNITKHLKINSIYFGGGTPTLLTHDMLTRIMDKIKSTYEFSEDTIEISIEGAPDTIDKETLEFYKSLGFNRISIGIQTLNQGELDRIGRTYSTEMNIKAMETIREVGFDNVNYDLIYGLENQSDTSFYDSLTKVMSFSPSTLNLYPVVIRPKTGINKAQQKNAEGFADDNTKYITYEKNIDFLKEKGYRQETFVRFTNLEDSGYQQQMNEFKGEAILGLGVAARSYTPELHYSTDYSIHSLKAHEIINQYINEDFENNGQLIGFNLSEKEQQIRFIILNLLINNLNAKSFSALFNTDLSEKFKNHFDALVNEECIFFDGDNIRLTEKGLKYSSIIGELFYSDDVQERIFASMKN